MLLSDCVRGCYAANRYGLVARVCACTVTYTIVTTRVRDASWPTVYRVTRHGVDFRLLTRVKKKGHAGKRIIIIHSILQYYTVVQCCKNASHRDPVILLLIVFQEVRFWEQTTEASINLLNNFSKRGVKFSSVGYLLNPFCAYNARYISILCFSTCNL